jgi:hypothetical protein
MTLSPVVITISKGNRARSGRHLRATSVSSSPPVVLVQLQETSFIVDHAMIESLLDEEARRKQR